MQVSQIRHSPLFCTVTIFAILGVCFQSPLFAQGNDSPAEPQAATFSVSTNLVNQTVVVRDAYGRAITGLTKDAFTLYENDVQQDIPLFRPEGSPVSLAYVIDRSSSMLDDHSLVNAGIDALISEALPHDETMVVGFCDRIYVESPLTKNRQRVERALRPPPYGGVSLLFDSIMATVAHMRKSASYDRRVIVVFTDSGDFGSTTRSDQLIAYLLGSPREVLLYVVGIIDEGFPAASGRVKKELQNIVEPTGGRAVFPGSRSEMESACKLIARELRASYTLAYRPDNISRTEFRRLRVEVSDLPPGATVDYRDGYAIDDGEFQE